MPAQLVGEDELRSAAEPPTGADRAFSGRVLFRVIQEDGAIRPAQAHQVEGRPAAFGAALHPLDRERTFDLDPQQVLDHIVFALRPQVDLEALNTSRFLRAAVEPVAAGGDAAPVGVDDRIGGDRRGRAGPGVEGRYRQRVVMAGAALDYTSAEETGASTA